MTCPACKTVIEQWWSYCAMCGYHIAGGADVPPKGLFFECPDCGKDIANTETNHTEGCNR